MKIDGAYPQRFIKAQAKRCAEQLVQHGLRDNTPAKESITSSVRERLVWKKSIKFRLWDDPMDRLLSTTSRDHDTILALALSVSGKVTVELERIGSRWIVQKVEAV